MFGNKKKKDAEEKLKNRELVALTDGIRILNQKQYTEMSNMRHLMCTRFYAVDKIKDGEINDGDIVGAPRMVYDRIAEELEALEKANTQLYDVLWKLDKTLREMAQ